MLGTGQIHFIEADDVELFRMLFRRNQQLRETCIGRTIRHIFHIEIAEHIAVIHPRGAHGRHGQLLRRQAQRLRIEPNECGFPRAAHPGQNREPRRLGGNVEIQQIFFIVQKRFFFRQRKETT